MRHDDDNQNTLNSVPTEEASAAAGPIPGEVPVPVPVPGGDALTDPSMASFAPADAAATAASLGDLLKENFVRATLSPEENELTRDHHLRHEITGRLDEAVDAPDHSVLEEAHSGRR
ncbi:MAG TPA: hypothetical protein VGM86_17055 [Thermoanaerobaculia bacterium]|jgi:hypothetical protein